MNNEESHSEQLKGYALIAQIAIPLELTNTGHTKQIIAR